MKTFNLSVGRFVRVDKSNKSIRSGAGGGSGPKGKEKSVNVRPGLALGVITLQAGTKGPKLTLH